MAFKKGMAAVKESLEKSKNSSAQNTDTHWFGWNEGESKILRFLTDSDDIIVISVHEQVPTVSGKNKTFVCRGAFDEPCELCDREPRVYKRDLGYGIAVLREQVYEVVDGKRKPALDEDGNTIYKDLVTQYQTEVNGQTVLKNKPFVGIVSQGLKNFWGQISLIAERKGSLRDWDIEITRMGSGTATTYAPLVLEKSVISNMDKYTKFLPDIEGFLKRIGSQEYYDIHLHGKKAEEKKEVSTEVYTGEDEYEEEENIILDEKTMAERLTQKMSN